MALNPLSIEAAIPEYRNSTNSRSVVIPERLHILEKKNTVSNPPKAIFHQSQLPAIPFFATSSVTARGVSAAQVVATMAVPARYQGRFLPDRKNCFMSLPAAL